MSKRLRAWSFRVSSGRRLALLVAVLAASAAALALGTTAPAVHPHWYLPLHTAVEVLAVVVALLVFSTGWHGIDRRMPLRVALLAPAALAFGLLDLGHLMTEQGMSGIGMPDDEAATEIAFRLAARAVGVLGLLAVAFAPHERTVGRAVQRTALAAALGIVLLASWQALADPLGLPSAWIAGPGRKPFKTGCELALVGANVLAASLLLAQALRNGLRTDRYLSAAAAVMVLSGVSFAIAPGQDGLLNVAGHVYKVIAFLFLYRAVYVAAVQAPYLLLQRSERSLVESENKFRGLMEAAPDAIVLAGADGRIAMMNARAEQMFGVSREAAAGMPLEALVPPGAGQDETSCRRPYAGAFPAEVRRAAMPTGQQVAVVRDVSERRRLERAVLEQLTCDALTGLPNRSRILEALDEAIDGARRLGRTLAVLVLDLDEFRKVNSGYGWSGGDDVLRECAERLSALLQPGDMLARQGGNEFIVVQKNSDAAAAAALAANLLGCLREPYVLRGQRVFLSASVGVALLPRQPCDAEALLQMAQVAMGSARAEGHAQYRFHTAEMAEAIRERVDMEALLRHALERGQLVLQFQPRICVAGGAPQDGATGGAIVGVEALVRWRHPVLGLVPPGRFIPIAEETGMIEELDLWVLREACVRAAGWRGRGLPPVRVSVNLSARQFQQAGLDKRVRAALEYSGLPPSALELEITESTVMRDTGEAASVLRSLKALGVALSIDDFGTGYSSLSYLKRFPLDVLKIDRSFVKDVIDDPNDAAITCAIIALAHGLNLEAVAEGVETREQMEFLKAHGCDEIQGYYFSPPVWAEQLEAMLEKESVGNGDLVK